MKPADDGSFFIDRDPFVFRHVLNFLRGMPLDTNVLTPAEKSALEEEAQFYQIRGLIIILEGNLVWNSGPNYLVSDRSKIVTKTGLDGWNMAAISAGCLQSGFGIRILSKTLNIMVGVAPVAVGQPVGDYPDFQVDGWYLYLKDGWLYSSGKRISCYIKNGLKMRTAAGVEVEVELSLARDLSFTIEGVNYGTAFAAIPKGDLVACVGLYLLGDCVEIYEAE